MRLVKLRQTTRELSSQQQIVLTWLSQGYKAEEVAERMELSRKTIHDHLQVIYHKYNVNNLIRAINLARIYGQIPDPIMGLTPDNPKQEDQEYIDPRTY